MSAEPNNISSEVYKERRNKIRKYFDGGVVLWLGHKLQPRNYLDNTYPFRQNSHFLYYTGLSEPDFAILSYPEEDYDVLFSIPATMDDIIWSGADEERVDTARRAGIDTIESLSRLKDYLSNIRKEQQTIHYLPPYQATSLLQLANLLDLTPAALHSGASRSLVEGVAAQRSVKSGSEIAEIEGALRVTHKMNKEAMAAAQPGIFEFDLAGIIQCAALQENCQQAFQPIVTVRGEVLHNHSYTNQLQDGQLILIDAGAESPNFYASDITRTFPVNGKFSSRQKEVYELVLRMQLGAIEIIKPGLTYRDAHLQATIILAEGLIDLGLMRGNPEDAVEVGAHALFFPHGLGHMMGIDVHDMEDLGDIVGYPKGESRSKQFGLKSLRLSRILEPGFVITVEPGIYFIPALIDRWKQECIHRDFINYDKLESYRTFGGIRIEDDVLVTEDGVRVLGPGIPKTVAEVEAAMSG